MKEIFKDIKGYENLYKISNLGRVKSLHNESERFLSAHKKNGYPFIALCKNGKAKGQYLHRILAIHFIDNVENKSTVNHKNGIKSDFRLSNLEWMTQSENNQHAYDTGLKIKIGQKCEESPSAKVTLKDVLVIRYLYPTGNYTLKKLGDLFNVTGDCIWRIVNNKTWVKG